MNCTILLSVRKTTLYTVASQGCSGPACKYSKRAPSSPKKQRRANFGPPTVLGPRALHALHALLLRHWLYTELTKAFNSRSDLHSHLRSSRKSCHLISWALYDLVLVFSCNYVAVLQCFRNITAYFPKYDTRDGDNANTSDSLSPRC